MKKLVFVLSFIAAGVMFANAQTTEKTDEQKAAEKKATVQTTPAKPGDANAAPVPQVNPQTVEVSATPAPADAAAKNKSCSKEKSCCKNKNASAGSGSAEGKSCCKKDKASCNHEKKTEASNAPATTPAAPAK